MKNEVSTSALDVAIPLGLDVSAQRPSERLLGKKEVLAVLGISNQTLWRMRRSGRFPHPVRISVGRVGWRASEVAAWIAALEPSAAEVPPAALPH